MITTIISDFSRVILLPKDPSYTGGLNPLHREKSAHAHYAFADHFIFNEELLRYYEKLRANFSVNIFTTGSIQDLRVVRNKIDHIFNRIYSVRDIKHKKDTVEAYQYILDDLSRTPEETVYIDDTVSNIEVAKRLGIHTVHYMNNETLFKRLKELFVHN